MWKEKNMLPLHHNIDLYYNVDLYHNRQDNNMTTVENNTEEPKRSISFVEQLIEEDLAEGKNGGRSDALPA